MATSMWQVNPMNKVQPMPPSEQPVTWIRPVILMPLYPPERDYLGLAIVSFFFFILLAIPALIFSLKTRDTNLTGNRTKARRNSRLALGFSITSIIMGTIVMIISIVLKALRKGL